MSFRLVPLIIFAILTFINFGIVLAKHGEPRPNYNIFISLIDMVMSWGLLVWMIW
jgi:hypothetical protein